MIVGGRVRTFPRYQAMLISCCNCCSFGVKAHEPVVGSGNIRFRKNPRFQRKHIFFKVAASSQLGLLEWQKLPGGTPIRSHDLRKKPWEKKPLISRNQGLEPEKLVAFLEEETGKCLKLTSSV